MAKSLEFNEEARRALERGVNRLADAVKVTRWEDHGLLAGMPYRYHVCAYGAAGYGDATSNTVTVSLPSRAPLLGIP